MKLNLKSLAIAAMVAAATTACNTDQELIPQGQELLIDAPAFQNSANGQVIPGKYIVVFKKGDGKAFSPLASHAERVQATGDLAKSAIKAVKANEASISDIYGSSINGFAAELTEEQALELAKREDIAHVEQDRVIALAPGGRKPRGGDGGGSSPSQSTPYGINRVNGGVNYSGSNVAFVIDSGVDLDHPDLNVAANRGVLPMMETDTVHMLPVLSVQ